MILDKWSVKYAREQFGKCVDALILKLSFTNIAEIETDLDRIHKAAEKTVNKALELYRVEEKKEKEEPELDLG